MLSTLHRLLMLGARRSESKQPTPSIRPTDQEFLGTCATSSGVSMEGKYPSVSSKIQRREQDSLLGANSSRYTTHLTQGFIPNWMRTQNHYDSRVFCGQFSSDGKVFMIASQDRHIRLYNTDTVKSREWVPFKDISCRHVGWAVLDIDYSPDDRFLIYSTWSNYVQLCNIYGDYELHEGLSFRPSEDRFALFSIKFSPDNREIIGGASDGCIYVYDVERKERVLRLEAHDDDVNTVAFGDVNSQILLSGSDDTLCKVWDRRLLDSSSSRGQVPVGFLTGHNDGITHVNPKGDGRYFISNSKDQTLKLWDMRKMNSAPSPHAGPSRTDYRYGQVSEAPLSIKPDDTSLATFRGHRVMETLIRCYFSPEFSTGQRYIISGSANGDVLIYDLITGQSKRLVGHDAPVRDVSWHPYLPMIVSSSWDQTAAKWEYFPGQPQAFPPLAAASTPLEAPSSSSSSSSVASSTPTPSFIHPSSSPSPSPAPRPADKAAATALTPPRTESYSFRQPTRPSSFYQSDHRPMQMRDDEEEEEEEDDEDYQPEEHVNEEEEDAQIDGEEEELEADEDEEEEHGENSSQHQ